MITTNGKTYQLSITETKTYMVSALFVLGNIILPQLCHLIPQGGLIFLPIYFFTLIAAYKYGMTAGLMTATLSPIINHLWFGMPSASILPILLVKGLILAVAAALIASKTKRITLPLVALAVVSYLVLGGMVEWAMTGSFASAMQDIILGYPGALIQVFGGWFVMKKLR